MSEFILFRPGDCAASVDVKTRELSSALTFLASLRSPYVVQVSFRRAWTGNGYMLLLRASRCDEAGCADPDEFFLWRFHAQSHGILKDVANQWHTLDMHDVEGLLNYLELVQKVQDLRVRLLPRAESLPAMVTLSPAPVQQGSKLTVDRVWGIDRLATAPEEPRDVLPDWSLSGDGIALLDGGPFLADLRRLRGPGRSARVPYLAHMRAMPPVEFGIFDARLEHAQRIVRVTRLSQSAAASEDATTQDACGEDVYAAAMCSKRVPGTVSWFSKYDATVRAISACQQIFGQDEFRLRMCFEDGSGWLWFSPEDRKAPLGLSDTGHTDLAFLAAVKQIRPVLTDTFFKLLEEIDPGALTLEDVFVQNELQTAKQSPAVSEDVA